MATYRVTGLTPDIAPAITPEADFLRRAAGFRGTAPATPEGEFMRGISGKTAKVGPGTFGGETSAQILERIRAANPVSSSVASEAAPAVRTAGRGVGRAIGGVLSRAAVPLAIATELALPAEANAGEEALVQGGMRAWNPADFAPAPTPMPSHVPSLVASRPTPNALGLSEVTPVPQPDAAQPKFNDLMTSSGQFREQAPGEGEFYTAPAGIRTKFLPGGQFVAATGTEGNFATPEQIAEDQYWTQRAEDLGVARGMGGRIASSSRLATALAQEPGAGTGVANAGEFTTTRGVWNRFVDQQQQGQAQELPTTASMLENVRLSGIGGLAAINLASRLAGQERGIRYNAIAQQRDAADLALRQEQEARQAEMDKERLGVQQFEAETGRLNAAAGLRNAMQKEGKTEDKFGLTMPTQVLDPATNEMVSKPGSIKVGDVERPIETPEEYADLHSVASATVQARRKALAAEGKPPLTAAEEDKLYRDTLEARWLGRRVPAAQ